MSDVAVYELPVLSSVYGRARWFIDGGMTRRTPDAAAHARTITVIGLNPAQWSWTNPGRVAATLDDAPPGAGECSSTITSSPARARLIAQTRPADPAPITATRLSRVIGRRDYQLSVR